MDNNLNEKINEIRQQADIVDIVSRHINVVKKGKNHFAICPFHNDTNPSLSISKLISSPTSLELINLTIPPLINVGSTPSTSKIISFFWRTELLILPSSIESTWTIPEPIETNKINENNIVIKCEELNDYIS